ncbi:MAG: GDP-mannose 4,6-dehydratase [Bacilli bacterium]|nr:GDP-mannose 4,6-dehydratase [Bacilli bacterium]
MNKVLITGAAGFIGYYLSKELIDNNYQVIGIDNLNDYYDVSLKKDRINNISDNKNFIFINEDINNIEQIKNIFIEYKPDIVIHLAAYGGVRYSLEKPDVYIKNNIDGFYNILKIASDFKVKHFVFTSSSSIYGNINGIPSKEEDAKINQESLYASTKMCDEVIAYSFSKLYDMPITAIRPFTVYGPLGRPDMAYFSFTNKLINKEEITLYHNGNLKRDYTYITDAINGIYSIIINKPNELYNVYNIAGSKQYSTNELVSILKEAMIENNLVNSDFDFDSLIKYSDMKKGEVNETYADISKINQAFNYVPKVDLKTGIKEFIKWYKKYYTK